MPMKAANIPSDESERLLALHRLGLMDTAPTESLDRITGVAARTLDVPILLVTLLDSDRQWFKSRVGLEMAQTSREVSFCSHAVFERRPLIVRNAQSDERFADNPLVTGVPYIRAYLGIPLFTSDNQPVGTLCAIDTRPRDFNDGHIEVLQSFARLVEDSIRARELAIQTQGMLQHARDRERLFRETFELAAVGIAHMSLDGKPLRVNRRACEIVGYTEEELRTIPFVDLTHPEEVAVSVEHFQQMCAGATDSYRLEKRFLRKDGTYVWVDLSVSLKRDESGKPVYVISVVEDISAKKHVEAELLRARDSLAAEVASQTRQLRDQNQTLRTQVIRVLASESAQRQAEGRLRAIANSIPAMIGYWNKELRCEFANEAYRGWFGIAPEQLLGMSMADFMGAEVFTKNAPYARLALSGQEQRFERTVRKVDGTILFMDVRYLPDIDQGEVRGFYVQATDVSSLRTAKVELEELNSKLKRDSTTDYLTGIANRRVFTERSEAAARRFRESNEPYGLIVLDVDNFKHVNDQYGHEIGDQVLGVLGRVLREQMRDRKDLAARLGGEEFAVLCFGELHEESLCRLAERLRGQICAEVVHTQKGALAVTCSFGVASSCAEDMDWKAIYARADAALYEAKFSGKNRVVFGHTAGKSAGARFRSARTVAPKG
jgi:diguanylate cyclase (GGDEF)-like protein/PAS domain S-box-containing protein